MPLFRIHRLKESAFQHFRWAPHTAGASPVKPKDYEPAGEVEAPSPYAAWSQMQNGANPLRVGDLLESESGALRICKYVGFEEAAWVLPEPKPDAAASPAPEEAALKP